jgi:hypothetical protein
MSRALLLAVALLALSGCGSSSPTTCDAAQAPPATETPLTGWDTLEILGSASTACRFRLEPQAVGEPALTCEADQVDDRCVTCVKSSCCESALTCFTSVTCFSPVGETACAELVACRTAGGTAESCSSSSCEAAKAAYSSLAACITKSCPEQCPSLR